MDSHSHDRVHYNRYVPLFQLSHPCGVEFLFQWSADTVKHGGRTNSMPGMKFTF